MSKCRCIKHVWDLCKAVWVVKVDHKAPNKVQLVPVKSTCSAGSLYAPMWQQLNVLVKWFCIIGNDFIKISGLGWKPGRRETFRREKRELVLSLASTKKRTLYDADHWWKKVGAMFGMFACPCLCMTLSPGLLISALHDLDLRNYYQSPLVLSLVWVFD